MDAVAHEVEFTRYLGQHLDRTSPEPCRVFLWWSVPPPRNWLVTVNAAECAEELASLRKNVQRGTPYGQPKWQERTASRLGLESSLRPRGRPRLSQ